MSTIKVNELATQILIASNLFIHSNSSGVAYKNNLTALSNFINIVGTATFRGSLNIADTPTLDGWYFSSESGTFTKAGGLVVNLANGLSIIIRETSGASYSQIVIPLTQPTTADVSLSNNSIAVNGSGVFVGLEGKCTLIKSVNIFDKSTITPGDYVKHDNTPITGSPTYDGSAFIRVDPSTQYVFNRTRFITWFDSNKSLLSGGSYVAGTTTQTFPSNVYYVKIALWKTDLDFFQFEKGAVSTSFVPFSEVISVDNLPDTTAKNQEEGFIKSSIGKNLLNESTLNASKSVNTLTGTLSVDSLFSASDYIKVLPSQTYHQNYKGNFAIYDINKVYISGAGSLNEVVIPVNGEYVRTTLENTDKGFMQFESGKKETKYVAYKVQLPQVNIPVIPTTNLITVKDTGVSGVDADFCGKNAIQDAIDSVLDAVEDNQYQLDIDGQFGASSKVGFNAVPILADTFAIISGKNWVNLNFKSGSVVYGEIPASDPAKAKYQVYFPVGNQNITGQVSFIAKNLRYAIHDDSQKNIDLKHEFKGLTIIEEGCWRAIGSGQASGCDISYKECVIIGVEQPITSHNNTNFSEASSYGFHECIFSNKTTGRVVNMESNGSLQKDRLVLHNNVINNGYMYQFSSFFSTDLTLQSFDHAEWRFTGSGNTPLPYQSNLNGNAIRITANTGDVRFDENSTAFSSIIGDKTQAFLYEDNYFRKNVNGYAYKDNFGTIKGYAIGKLDIGEDKAGKSLGVRLGDCSTVNKTLIVTINSVVYNILFNTNLTGVNNTGVIAIINAVIGGFSTVDTFAVGNEYYPEFTDQIGVYYNNSASVIYSGMAVYINNGGIRKATSLDKNIAVVIEDIPINGRGRAVFKGVLYAPDTILRFKIKGLTNFGLAENETIQVSSTDGLFEKGTTNVVGTCLIANQVNIGF